MNILFLSNLQKYSFISIIFSNQFCQVLIIIQVFNNIFSITITRSLAMDSSSDNQKSSDQQFTQQVKEKKNKSKQRSKSKQKKGGKGKGGKKPKEKQKKEGKQAKQAKQAKKKKASKSKDKQGNFEKDLETVKQYLQKQNRPYNLLNIFDNLHGSIKKGALQIILDKLVQSQVLTCKQFGKNKVYFLNQSKFDINQQLMQKINIELMQSRQQHAQIQSKYKELSDQYRKLLSMKTQTQLQQQIQSTKQEIEKLQEKQQKLLHRVENKIEESIVIGVEKQQQKLRRELKKYRKIVKDAVKTWAEILEKKTNQVVDIMGLDM